MTTTAEKEPPVKDGKRLWRGVWIDARYSKWQAELYLFGRCPHGEKKFRLWKSFLNELWPEPIFFQDEWSDLFFAALCGAGETVERLTGQKVAADQKWWRNVIFTGAGSTGKSAKAGLWVLGNWLVDQQFTMGVLTSTSVKMLGERIWADIVLWIGKAKFNLKGGKNAYLEILNSDLEIRHNPDDKKGMITGMAVKSGGDVNEAVDRIKGKHNRRVFVVIDEMTSVPAAIVTACRNLNKGTHEFQLIGIANARRKDDPHGERSEPINGWGSVTPDTGFWITKYGCAVHFNGLKNPGLKDPHRLYFYPTQEQMDEDAREQGGVNSAEYWSGTIGFWPPSGISTTVMDEALLEQFEVSKPAIWKELPEMAGFLDPSFEGGDRRVLYPAKVGTFADGVRGIEYLAPIIVGIDASTDTRWIHYAIADAVKNHCENYMDNGVSTPIPPRNFMMDTTGEGGGLFSVLSGTWSPDIRACEFGGGAEKQQIFPDRPTTYAEIYGNRVTAMWYRMRRYIEGGQIRGLSDPSTRKELTSRDKKMKSGKTFIVPKSEMKLTGHRSPDLADAAVIGGEFLFVSGTTPAGKTGATVVMDVTNWNRMAEQRSMEDNTNDYSDEEAAFV